MTTRPTSDVAMRRAPRRDSAKRFPLKLVAQGALVLPVIALAWFFGGVQATHQVWLFAGLLAALCLFIARSLVGRPQAVPLPSALLPLMLALVIGVVQLVPLPAGVQAYVGAENHSLWETLLPSNSPDPKVVDRNAQELSFARELGVSAVASRPPLSLAPGSTRHDLALLVAAVATFFLAARLFGGSSAMLGLFGVTAVNGAALAFFGLAQQLRWNGLLFGSVPLSEGGAPFASFVNRNSGAGFLNMCLGASIALAVWAFTRHLRCDSSGDESDAAQEPTSHRLIRAVSDLNTAKLAAISLCALVFAGVVCSLSRGAWISAAVAAITTVLATCLIHRAWGRVSLLIAAGVLGLALVGWVGRMEKVEQRFATLWNTGDRPDSRLAHWQNGLVAASDFVVFGSGLGTYRYVYKLYEQNGSQSWFYHAENQYLEALVEGGVPGLLLMLISIAIVLSACWRLLHQPPNSPAFATGVGGLFVLVSQSIHAAFDFGLYMPANMALLAMICGGVCGLAVRHSALPPNVSNTLRGGVRTNRRSAGWLALPTIRALPICLASLLAAAVAWGGIEIGSTAQVETALRASRIDYQRDSVSVTKLDELMSGLERAALEQPDHAEALQTLGQLRIHRYRLEAFGELQSLYPPDTDPDPLWNLTSTVNLHRKLHSLRRSDPRGDLRSMRRADDVRIYLTNAARALIEARRACPLLVKPHLLLAEIAPVISSTGDDAPSLERAIRLSVGDHDLLVEAGLLALQADQPDLACELWRRSIEVLPERYYRVLDLAAEQPACKTRLADLIPDSPELMVQVARDYFDDDEDAEVRARLAERAYELLAAAPDLELAKKSQLQGAALALSGKFADSLEPYARALQLRPEITSWRYEYARALAGAGQLDEAERQAVMCCKLDPKNEQYIEFQRELIRRRLAGDPPFDRQNRSTDNDTSQKVTAPTEYSLVETRP